VPITLLVRGICGLRPNVPGVSERISGCARSSTASRAFADRLLQERRTRRGLHLQRRLDAAQLHRRVEVMIPILDPDIKGRLMNEILALSRATTSRAGTSAPMAATRASRPRPAKCPFVPNRFIELERERGERGRSTHSLVGPLPVRPVHPVAKNGIPEERRRRQQNVQLFLGIETASLSRDGVADLGRYRREIE